MENTYTEIPGFKEYEIGSINNIVRNKKSKVMQTLKKGTNKFYLKNDAGERKLIHLKEILESLPKQEKPVPVKKEPAVKKPKAEKVKKEPKVKQPHVILVEKERLEELRAKHKATLENAEYKQHQKIWKLHKAGLIKPEISVLIGCSINNVYRGIWMYKEGYQKDF